MKYVRDLSNKRTDNALIYYQSLHKRSFDELVALSRPSISQMKKEKEITRRVRDQVASEHRLNIDLKGILRKPKKSKKKSKKRVHKNEKGEGGNDVGIFIYTFVVITVGRKKIKDTHGRNRTVSV